jgi:hypothetical protein
VVEFDTPENLLDQPTSRFASVVVCHCVIDHQSTQMAAASSITRSSLRKRSGLAMQSAPSTRRRSVLRLQAIAESEL